MKLKQNEEKKKNVVKEIKTEESKGRDKTEEEK